MYSKLMSFKSTFADDGFNGKRTWNRTVGATVTSSMHLGPDMSPLEASEECQAILQHIRGLRGDQGTEGDVELMKVFAVFK